MLYKFKSKASADVIMLPAHGKALVEAMGKTAGEAGTVTAIEAQAVWNKLNQRLIELATLQKPEAVRPQQGEEASKKLQPVSEAQRWQPVMKMLQSCHSAQVPMVWSLE